MVKSAAGKNHKRKNLKIVSRVSLVKRNFRANHVKRDVLVSLVKPKKQKGWGIKY